MNKLEMGCGLIGIGRKWGVVETSVPAEAEVTEFLNTALALGITFFDTAPAYALSEQRLGGWLSQLSATDRSALTIATKTGEHWNAAEDKPYKDFSFDALQRSVDQSLRLLGRISILQIHGVTPQVLVSSLDAINRVFEYARSVGIEKVGMSLSDPKAFDDAVNFPGLSVLQIQHNSLNPYPSADIQKALDNDVTLITNRPFGMGQLAVSGEAEKVDALRFILQTVPKGIVLTGTKSPEHLKENLHLFEEAKK